MRNLLHSVPACLSILAGLTILATQPALAADLPADTEAAWKSRVESLRQMLEHQPRKQAAAKLHHETKPIVVQWEYLDIPAVRGEVELVPTGLIHHWIGAIVIPGAHVADLLSVLQRYESYPTVYAPAVIQSKVIAQRPDDFTYELKFVQKGFGIKTGLLGQFRTTYVQTDAGRGHSITEATRLMELQSPGTPDERVVAPAESHGYVRRSFTIVRYEQRREGVLVEVESLTLSRDLSASVRWLVMPVVRRFSQQTVAATLEQLRSHVPATQIMMAASGTSNSH